MHKVAVIGTGFISTNRHLPAWLRLRRRAMVAAVCDADKDRAESVAREFGIESTYDNVEQLLDEEKPDFVDICTPPSTHADLTVTALEAGAHVLIEKPMAMNVQECDRIIDAAGTAKRQVCVVHSELFYPPVVAARKLVADGKIGDFRGMRIFRATPVGYMTSIPNHWANRLPGGVIGETGPHVVYLTLAFISPIQDLWVSGRKLASEYAWSPFDDYRLEMTGTNGTSSAVLTYANDQWAAQVDIWGSRGMLKIDLQSKTLVHHKRNNLSPKTLGISAMSEAIQIGRSTLSTATNVLTGRFRNTHSILIGEFFNRTVRGLPTPVSAEEGRETVRIMNLIADRLTNNEATYSDGRGL